MSKRSRPEQPVSKFSAARNKHKTESDSIDVEPKRRMRDEKSNVSPFDALKKAQEISEHVSEPEASPTATPASKPLTEQPKRDVAADRVDEPDSISSKPVPAPFIPKFKPQIKEAPIPKALTSDTPSEPVAKADDTAQNPIAAPKRASVTPNTKRVSDALEAATEGYESAQSSGESFRKPEAEPEPASEFINYIPSPFMKDDREPLFKEENKLDSLFNSFVERTENDGYVPGVYSDDEELKPLDVDEHEDDSEFIEDDLLVFDRITPETDIAVPDFDAMQASMLSVVEKRHSKIRRVSFPDIRRRGSSNLPIVRKDIKSIITPAGAPVRKLSPERYLGVYAVPSPFASGDKKAGTPSYKRKISPSLKKAILEDRPHSSEKIQPESYDVDAPLPELIESDFIDEGLPQVFVEGGPSVEEVIKAKRAERRAIDGQVRRDLTASDFVEEAFSEFFIDYAERYNQSYEQMRAPAVADSRRPYVEVHADSFSEDLLDWQPVLPPASPFNKEALVPAGVITDDRDFDIELSVDDYVDEPDIRNTPVNASSLDSDSYREAYMDSLDPDLFLGDFFSDNTGNSMSVIPPSPVPADDVVSGVPLRAEGSVTVNRSWSKYNTILTIVTVLLISGISFGATLLRGESIMIAFLISSAAVIVGALATAFRSNKYRKVVVDFEQRTLSKGKQTISFDDITWGEGSSFGKGSLLSPKVLKLGSDGREFIRLIIEGQSFKISQTEAEAVVEMINQTGLPYSSDEDLDDLDVKVFGGTKRNLSMLVNSSYMS